jgi:hypothetical protein
MTPHPHPHLRYPLRNRQRITKMPKKVTKTPKTEWKSLHRGGHI